MGMTPHSTEGLQVGTASELGGRQKQQDELLIRLDLAKTPDGRPVHLFGVFDGHGSEGHKAAAAVKKAFPTIVKSLLSKILSNPTEGLKEAYIQVHENLLEDSSIDAYMSGTTAVVALLIENQLLVSHVGDSRLIKISEENGVYTGQQITLDHTCDVTTEYERVKATGARVEQLQTGETVDGPLRIFKGSLPYPGIVVTRSLGDSVATRLGVLHEPAVQTLALEPQDRCIVLATDGLWDALSVKEATDIVAQHSDAQTAATELTNTGLTKLINLKLDDNTTTVVVRLDHASKNAATATSIAPTTAT
ncbi:phosphatase 2C-like domain-containing protein [Entophlyctis helioformis]|nr:phosphatase 2C-like domain-containing protein [Entophlyctis helioformis]